MIKLEHITQTYVGPDGKVFEALKDVSIEIKPGEIFGIIGRSGAGKSTLVRCINLLNRPTKGAVIVDGRDLTKLGDSDLRDVRRSIGMIFQHFNLLSSRTVYDNIALPLELIGTPKDRIRSKIEPLIELVGLTEHVNKYPSQLSGGQKQRVGIARALANDPKVLLSDEATSALDPETTVATLQLLQRINEKLGVTIVMITHEMNVVKQICGRVVVMNKGEIVEQGDVIDIFARPQSETTRALIGQVMDRDLPQSIVNTVNAARGKYGRDNVHLLHLSFIGEEVAEPVISLASREFNIDFSILRGTVDDLQGRTLGTLTLLVVAPTPVYKQAVDFIRNRGVLLEEITNV